MTTLTADDFTGRVMAALAAADDVIVTPLRTLALTVETADRIGTLDLTWAWRDVQREPHRLNEIVASAATKLPAATQTDTLRADRVRPMLRTLEDLARLSTGRSNMAHPRSRPFCGDLVLSLVHDGEGSVRVLRSFDADRLALSDDALWALARNNLAQQPFDLVGALPVLQVLAGGTFDATCLWHPALTDGLPPGSLAAAPARSVLLLCPEPNPAGRKALVALADNIYETRNHQLSRTPLRWTGEVWEPAPTIGLL